MSLNCDVCKRKYASKKTYEKHLRSQKHMNNTIEDSRKMIICLNRKGKNIKVEIIDIESESSDEDND